jgi:hypothetical protein
MPEAKPPGPLAKVWTIESLMTWTSLPSALMPNAKAARWSSRRYHAPALEPAEGAVADVAMLPVARFDAESLDCRRRVALTLPANPRLA